ncbi:MAG: diguanylate cyclase [Candidatus Aminicenantales bacterium]
MVKGNILIINKNPQQRELIARICREISSSVSTAESVEEAISLIESNTCSLAVIDSSLADYSRFKGLFKKTTSVIITGEEEAQIKKAMEGWPLERYLDCKVISLEAPETTSDASLIRPLKMAMEHSQLKSEVAELKKSIELLQAELKETHLEIKEIMNFIQDNVVEELEKRIAIEAKYIGFQKEKRKIEKILKDLYNANDVTNLLDTVYDIKELVQAAGITIYILDENEKVGQFLKPLVWNNVFIIHKDFSDYITSLDKQDFAAICARYAKEINTSSLSFDRRLSKRYTEHIKPPLKNLLCMPITHNSRVTGVLEVYNKTVRGKLVESGFSRQDQEILRRLSEHISLAMTKLNLIQYDALTGLLRPDPFIDKVLKKINAVSKRRQEKASYAMVMGDVDWFKNYNDRNGHEAGNRLLRELSNVFKASVREEDLICRYGGEEFLIFLSGILDTEEACRLTERIRKNVEEHYFEHQEHQPRNNLTISFGLTLIPREKIEASLPLTRERLIKIINEADVALAEAKGKRTHEGTFPEKGEEVRIKNKVCCYRGEEEGERGEGKKEVIETYEETFPQEKRAHKRYYTSTYIVYTENHSHRVAKTINLSLGGAKILTESRLPEGKPLNLFLILGKKATNFESVVVYSERSPENSSRFCTGLKFKEVSLADRTILEEHFKNI